MTVSRVLRGEGDSQYYDQVMAAVQELNYVPVRSALQNRHIKTNTIGVLLDGAFVFDSLVGFQTFAGITKTAFIKGYDLVMLQPKGHRPLVEQKIQVLDRRCDGFIFVTPYERPEVLELLVESEFPAVTCYSNDVPKGVHSIVPDNVTAVRTAVELLRSAGHQKIGLWGTGDGHSDARERGAAYTAAMHEAGLEPNILLFDGLTDEMKINNLLSKHITALICHNDDRALSLWNAAAARGLQVPRDLSLIGIDDIEESARRGLTSFFNPFRSIGEYAVETMLTLLEGDKVPAACKRVPMRLMERTSVAPPKIVFR